MILPFVQKEDAVPPLPRGVWIGRVISDVRPGGALPDGGAQIQAWICQDAQYDFNTLHVKARNQVRKAIKTGAAVERLGWDEAWRVLPNLIADTFERQGRSAAEQFRWRLDELKCVDGKCWQGKVEIWVAKLPNGTVGSLILGLKDRSTYYILHQLSKTSELEWCPNNLLTFAVTQRALLEWGCKHVNYGVDGLDRGRLDGLARFKQRMGYALLPCSEQYVAARIVLALLRLASDIARRILRGWPRCGRFDLVRQLAGLDASRGESPPPSV